MPSNSNPHPSDEELTAWRQRSLSEDVGQAISAHLESCLPCRQRVLNLGKSQAQKLNEVANAPPIELTDHPEYELLEEIGRGGMGIVYKVRGRTMGRIDALKVVHGSTVRSETVMERFRQEIRNAALLEHHNIVRAYNVIDVGGRLGLVMEYVPGQTLSEVIKQKGPLSPNNACHYARQVASGLQHAMTKKLVHRDIKPDNLMLIKEGATHTVKILDFGLGKASSEASLGMEGDDTAPGTGDGNLTQAGSMLGTPYYVAPEQITDASRVDIRSDIYSLGCTLFYLLTGRQPFVGKNLKEILEGHLTGAIPGVRDLRPELPQALDDCIRQMMAKSPGDRPQQPKDLVATFSKILQQLNKPESGNNVRPTLPNQTMVPGASSTQVAPIVETIPQENADAFRFESPQVQHEPTFIPPVVSPVIPDQSSVIDPSFTMVEEAPTYSPKKKKQSSNAVKIIIGLVFLLMIVFAVVFSLRGNKPKAPSNKLRVWVNEPEAEVVLNGEKIGLTSSRSQTIEIPAPPGNHKIEVRKPGFMPFTEQLVLASGDQEVTAKLVPETAPRAVVSAPVEPFTSIMAGDATAPKWRLTGARSTIIQWKDSELIAVNTEQPGNPSALVTDRTNFQNFKLRGEFFVDDQHQSLSIYTRLDPSETQFGGTRGYYLQVIANDDSEGKKVCRVRYSLGSRLRKALDLATGTTTSLTNGQWHRFELKHDANRIQFSLNGQQIFDSKDDGNTFIKGAIGIAVRPRQAVHMRKLEIFETASSSKTTFGNDSRSRWVHVGKPDPANERWGVVQQISKTEWIESVNDREGFVRYRFREIARNNDFIELERPQPKGFLKIRLHNGFGGISTIPKQYVAWHAGKWEVDN